MSEYEMFKPKAIDNVHNFKKPVQMCAQQSPNLTGIPDIMKTQFESLSGFSFDDVRVHYNSNKPSQLQALAYTQGNQVFVGPNQEQHLPHELGHVVQQKQGIVKPTDKINDTPINTDSTLEDAADCIANDSSQYFIDTSEQCVTKLSYSNVTQLEPDDTGKLATFPPDILKQMRVTCLDEPIIDSVYRSTMEVDELYEPYAKKCIWDTFIVGKVDVSWETFDKVWTKENIESKPDIKKPDIAAGKSNWRKIVDIAGAIFGVIVSVLGALALFGVKFAIAVISFPVVVIVGIAFAIWGLGRAFGWW